MLATKEFTFDCAHRLPNHEGLCKNIHGHTYKVEVTVSGGLQGEGPEDGMIVDFKRLKVICNKLFNQYDHAYVSSIKDTEVNAFMQKMHFKLVIFPGSPTAERMAKAFYNVLQEWTKDEKFCIAEVKVWETPTSYSTYNESI